MQKLLNKPLLFFKTYDVLTNLKLALKLLVS